MLQDAKARFSELVRRARDVGPQHVTIHGRDEVVVVSVADFRKLNGSGRTGADIVAAFQASPFKDVEIEPERHEAPVRPVEF